MDNYKKSENERRRYFDSQDTSSHESVAQNRPVVLNETRDSLSSSLSNQIEALVSELRSGWEQGNFVTVESLGFQFDQIACNDEYLLDVIYHEVLLREEFGQTPQLEEFVIRFPNLTVRLERLFAVHRALEDDWQAEMAVNTQSETSPADQSSSDLAATPRGGAKRNPQWPRKSNDRYPMDPPPGYELLEELGRGGMAVVFRARQQILNRIVAIKMLHGGGIAGEEVLARIQQEAQAVAQLQHPGIVQIYEVGEHRGLPFLSLEYVPGGTLLDWISGRALAPMVACRIVEQLARIAHFAHEHGIVHRDLKPANVLLTEKPNTDISERATLPALSRSGSSQPDSYSVKIGDFGLARVVDHCSDLTATGQIIGTPSYMAPEQAAGSITAAAPAQDVYSLGAILYELLTGRPPFKGATLYETLEQVRSDDPVSPRRLQPRVPKDLETVCLKCLEKSPFRRYATAQALADDLRAIQSGDSIVARPMGQLERHWKWIHRHPAIASLMLLTILLTVGGMTGIMIENHRANLRERDAVVQSERALRLSEVADRERGEAERLRQVAEQQTLQAESNLEQALTAIDAFAKLGMELRDAPLQQATSKRILDETLSLYDKLQEGHADSPHLRRQLAAALLRAGEIRYVTHDVNKANDALKRGLELLDDELSHESADRGLLELASWGSKVQGNVFNNTGRPAEALVAYDKSLRASESLLSLAPDNNLYVIDKTNTTNNICAALASLGRHQEALPRFKESIEILRTLYAKNPGDWLAASELALTLHDYSTTARNLKNDLDADAAFGEALGIRRKLLESKPDQSGNRVLYARMCVASALALRKAGDHEQSLGQFRIAEQMLEPLAARFPNVFEYQRDLIAALVHQLDTCFITKDPMVGKECWKKLAETLISARRSFSNDRPLAIQMEFWCCRWAEYSFESGDADETIRIWQCVNEVSIWLAQPSAENLDEPLTNQQMALYSNNAAWNLTIAPNPDVRDYSRARAFASRAVELEPENSLYLHTLGTIHYYSGEYEAALDVFERAIKFENPAGSRAPLKTTSPSVPTAATGDSACPSGKPA